MSDASFRGSHHTYRVATAAAASMSSIVLYDAIHHGLPGTYSGFSDEYGLTALMIIVGLVHGVIYLTQLAVLVVDGQRIEAAAESGGGSADC